MHGLIGLCSLLSLCSVKNQDAVLKLAVTTLDYSRDGLARVILSKILTAATDVRLQTHTKTNTRVQLVYSGPLFTAVDRFQGPAASTKFPRSSDAVFMRIKMMMRKVTMTFTFTSLQRVVPFLGGPLSWFPKVYP